MSISTKKMDTSSISSSLSTLRTEGSSEDSLTIPTSLEPSALKEFFVTLREREKPLSKEQISQFKMLISTHKEGLNLPTFYDRSTIFHDLAKLGANCAIPFVKILTKQGIDFGAQDSYLRNTPLMWAVANGNNAMAKGILRSLPLGQQSSLNKQDRNGKTVLHLLVAKGYKNKTSDDDPIPEGASNCELLEMALKTGANPNIVDREGRCALHIACMRRDTNMIKTLIAYGADPLVRDNQGRIPADYITYFGPGLEGHKRAKLAIEQIASPILLSEEDYCNSDNLKQTLQLMEEYTRYKKELTPTSLDPTSLKRFFSAFERNPLSKQHFIEFDRLISMHKDELNLEVFEERSTILHALAKMGSPIELVETLPKYEADFGAQDDSFKNTPLMWAVANGNNAMAKGILRFLPLEQQSSLNKRDYTGKTVLHFLVAKGYTDTTAEGEPIPEGCSNYELLKMALEAGADPNISDKDGITPLHIACMRRDIKMIELLLEYRANPNEIDKAGKQPLNYAMWIGDQREGYRVNKSRIQGMISPIILKEEDYLNSDKIRQILALLFAKRSLS